MCKYSLYDSKTTDALKNEADKNEAVPCTSQLQAWHKRGRWDNIPPQPVMDLVIEKTDDDDEARVAIEKNRTEELSA